MSQRLLDGLDPVAMLLLQVAARQEHVPVQLTLMAPLGEDPEEVVERVAERGLLAPSEVEGIHVLTPMGHALRDDILARWPQVHQALRPRLVAHLADELGLDPDAPLVQAFRVVDRASFIPEPGRVLADIDMPAPTGIGEMTTSAPNPSPRSWPPWIPSPATGSWSAAARAA